MANVKVACANCGNVSVLPEHLVGQKVSCPRCNQFCAANAHVDAPAIGATPEYTVDPDAGAASANTADSAAVRMLFASCPRCGATDVYAICANCGRFDGFVGSGVVAQCSCGMRAPEQITCPYCQALIFRKDFHPDPVKQARCRGRLPRSGKAGPAAAIAGTQGEQGGIRSVAVRSAAWLARMFGFAILGICILLLFGWVVARTRSANEERDKIRQQWVFTGRQEGGGWGHTAAQHSAQRGTGLLMTGAALETMAEKVRAEKHPECPEEFRDAYKEGFMQTATKEYNDDTVP